MSALSIQATPIPSMPSVPCHWQVIRNKVFMREINRQSEDGTEEMLSVSHLTGVTPRSEKTVNMFEAESTVGYKVVGPGDLVINTMWAWMGAAGVANVGGIVSPAYGVYELDQGVVDPRWVDLLIRTPAYITEMTRFSRGVTSSRLRLYPDEFLRLHTPIPPLNEQRTIADYLDTETARIDALITKKRRLIELLDERRTTYVSRVVTVGLGEVDDLVDTGDDYAKLMPSSWRLMRLRHVVESIIDTPHKTAPVVEDAEYLVVRTANVKKGRLVFNDARYTDRASWIEWNRRGQPRPGDVLFTREAPAGEACVVPNDPPLCIGQRMVLLRVNEELTSGEWIVHSIYSGAAQQFVENLSNETTVAHINMSDIPDIPVAIPSMDEQRRLLALIRTEVARLEAAIRKLEDQIGLLAEYRQALITSAVTGELALPGVAA